MKSVLLIGMLLFSAYSPAQSTRTGEQPYQYNRKVPLPSLSKKGVKTEVKVVKQTAVSMVKTDSTFVFLLDGVAVHSLTNYGYYSNHGRSFIYTPTQRFETNLGGHSYEDETTHIYYRITPD